MAGCPCPMCTGGMGGMGGLGGGMIPIIFAPGGGMSGMGGMIGGCGNPMCPECYGGMGGMGGMEAICNDPNCPGFGRPIAGGGMPCGDPNCPQCGGGMGGMGDEGPCGNPYCPECYGGGGGGPMPASTYPGQEGDDGMHGPDYDGGAGDCLQPPMGFGNSGGQTSAPTGPSLNAEPELICKGPTGQPIQTIIDTGLQSNAQTRPSGYTKHFSNFPLDRSESTSVIGVGGSPTPITARFNMELTFDFGNEQLMVEGNCWVYANENQPNELIIGMPFLRKNKMNMVFGPDGNFVEVKGRQIPINMITRTFRRIWPAGEPAYEGSGKPQYKLGGGSGIIPQAAHRVAAHGMPTHAQHIAHASHVHQTPATKGKHRAVKDARASVDSRDDDEALQKALDESVENMDLNSGDEDEDEDLQKALAESVKNTFLNSGINPRQHKLQKPMPLQNLTKSLVPKAGATRESYAKPRQKDGRSIEDMARIISARVAEKSRKEAQKKDDFDACVDEELDRAIALSLQDIDG